MDNYILFKNKNFRRLYYSKLISIFGNLMFKMIILYHVYEKTNSIKSVGMTFILIGLPNLLFGPIAGYLLDKYDKKVFLFLSEFINGLLIFFLIFITDKVLFFTIIFLNSVASIFYGPGINSYLLHIVDKDKLAEANAITSLTTRISSVLAPTITAILVILFNINIIFILNSISYFISAAIILTLPGAKHSDNFDLSLWTGLKEGFLYIRSSVLHKYIILTGFFVSAVIATNNTLIVMYSKKVYMNGIRAYGILTTCLSVGMLMGSILFTMKLKNRSDKFRLFVITLIIIAILMMIFPFITNLMIACIVRIVIGINLYIYFILVVIIIQSITKIKYIGRVNSLNQVVNNTSVICFVPIVILITDFFGYKLPFVVFGSLLLLVAVFLLFFNKLNTNAEFQNVS
ncbi:hypothetical protein BBF96_12840 [Anoxybacter fermentans]|uniref:Major facilitator superfamily (MFS) profile domain-containing protein n=1 Tax=Anoxybacter fermentans TaxID=1323375 RepID=A0A3Q9HRN1_9FIRM|nr:MFS transporter [Anoxybacter fermentans]AZR74207.1 hypothetical protein BBF96_12840 [Anoxybacter fermentans]